jgi:hypothetical protein
VFQFGYGPIVDRPIVVDLPAQDGYGDFLPLPALYQVGNQQVCDIVVNWKIIKSQRSISEMLDSITVNGRQQPILPAGAVQVAKGERSGRSESFNENGLYLGPAITTSYPWYEAIDGTRYFMWAYVQVTNVVDDFSYYERWNECHSTINLNQPTGYEMRLQILNQIQYPGKYPEADPEFTDILTIPTCKFPAFEYTIIQNMISYDKWVQDGQPPTFTITNS